MCVCVRVCVCVCVSDPTNWHNTVNTTMTITRPLSISIPQFAQIKDIMPC